jgi:CHAT domain-containing protein
MQLPLHAAGIYTGFERISCSDYCVISYTPSLTALLNAQCTSVPIRRASADTLLVVVQHPFQGSTLPMVAEEASIVRRLVPSKVVEASNCTDALENVRSASILHMACHGSQNHSNALQSGFTLEDGLLTVSKLMELELSNAFLAILSACETAKGDASQPDQAIHLAATMLFAGFKSVVATMWYALSYFQLKAY